MYNIMSSANSESFNFCFSIWIPFISFSSLIAVARTFRTMLNYSGKSRHRCLVPDLSGNVFSFSPLRIMFSVQEVRKREHYVSPSLKRKQKSEAARKNKRRGF